MSTEAQSDSDSTESPLTEEHTGLSIAEEHRIAQQTGAIFGPRHEEL